MSLFPAPSGSHDPRDLTPLSVSPAVSPLVPPKAADPPDQDTFIGDRTPPYAPQPQPLADPVVTFPQAQARLQQGLQLHQQSQYPQARGVLEQALADFRTLDQPLAITRTLLALAQVSYALADYLWALNAAQQAATLAHQLKQPLLEQQALNHVGNSYRHLGDTAKALDSMTKSLALAQQLDDRAAQITAHNNLGMVYKLRSNYDQAITHYRASLVLVEATGDSQLMGRILRNLGNAYHAQGNYEQTVVYFDRLLQLLTQGQATATGEAGSDTQAISRILRNLSNACYNMRDHRRTIDYLNQRLVIACRQRDIRNQEQILESMGINYDALGEAERALECREKRFQVSLTSNDPRLQRQALDSLKEACLSTGDFARVMPYVDLLMDSQGGGV